MKRPIYMFNSQGKKIRITRAVRDCAYHLRNMHQDSINFARASGTYSGHPVDYEYRDTDNVMGGLSYQDVLNREGKDVYS